MLECLTAITCRSAAWDMFLQQQPHPEVQMFARTLLDHQQSI